MALIPNRRKLSIFDAGVVVEGERQDHFNGGGCVALCDPCND
jgi:hypothetical protein